MNTPPKAAGILPYFVAPLPAQPAAAPCPHPAAALLRNIAHTWCPWCGRSDTAERALSVLSWLRTHGPAHHWRVARELLVRRKVAADLLRLLGQAGRVEAVATVRVRDAEGCVAVLRLWRAR